MGIGGVWQGHASNAINGLVPSHLCYFLMPVVAVQALAPLNRGETEDEWEEEEVETSVAPQWLGLEIDSEIAPL